MWVFLGKRLLLVLLTLLGLTVVVFVVSHVTPGDPARLAAGPDASQEQIALIRTEFGLDRSLPVQYAIYLKGVLQGNFGRSIRTRHDVSDDIKVFLPATLELVFFTMGLAAVLGILFGILAAAYRDTWLDHLLRLVSIGGVAVPMFWLALMLQLLVALKFNLLPSGGRLAIAMSPPTTITGFFLVDALLTGNWAAVGSALTHLVLPALVLSSPSLAAVTRMMRADMLDTISREYVVNARANGLPERLIVAKYVLKNALIPTVTADRPPLWLDAGRHGAGRDRLRLAGDRPVRGAELGGRGLHAGDGGDAGHRVELRPGKPGRGPAVRGAGSAGAIRVRTKSHGRR